jgi:hypothetical protein
MKINLDVNSINRIIVFIIVILNFYSCNKQNKIIENSNIISEKSNEINVSKDTICSPCFAFDTLNSKVRDGLITKSQAKEKIENLLPEIIKFYKQKEPTGFQKQQWVFPLEGYGPSVIGGKNGDGYKLQGYSYFDGNKHTGHPAQDIFINDNNQDCLDDKTGNPVNVLSISGGIVIGVYNNWESNSILRGGNYIWIYDPENNSVFYYAHNNVLYVKPGDIVKPGDKIATVGRSGKNAFVKRSPTHLHLSYYKMLNGEPIPEDPYSFLMNVKRK